MHCQTCTIVLPLPLKGNLNTITFDELVSVLLQEEHVRDSGVNPDFQSED